MAKPMIRHKDLPIEEVRRLIFERAAHVLWTSWKTGIHHTGLLDDPLIPNHLVQIGNSVMGREWREHVVPRNLVYDHAMKMFDASVGMDEVAAMLRKYVLIARISRAEQKRIDHELGWKTRMPGDLPLDQCDPMARLKGAGVVLGPEPTFPRWPYVYQADLQ